MAECVVIRPSFDEPSRISYGWCEEVVGWLRNAGYEVTDLAKDKATRIEVENAIKAGNPDLIVFYDHGNRYGLAEQGGEGYVIDKENDILLKNREIYTLACLSQDTEILSRDGWKSFNEVRLSEEVLTFNPKKDQLEFQPILAKIVKDWNGEMINIKGGGERKCSIDLLVTPDHRILFEQATRSRAKRTRKVVEAGKIRRSAQIYLPVAFPASLPNTLPLSDAEISLLGWIISEGDINTKKGRIRISQSLVHSDKINKIRQLLHQARIHFHEEHMKAKNYTKNKDYAPVIRFGLWKEDSSRLMKWLPSNKQLTREILNNASWHQLYLLYNALIDGDGSRRKNNTSTYYTKNPVQADLFQELVTLLGFHSVKTISKRGLYEIYISENKHWRFIRKIERVPYNGIVWCVTVPNGFIVVRRNGRVAIVGNCLWGSDGGIDAWKKGARAVWCYTKEFGFSTDALAEFGRFANEGLRLRLEGKSWIECLRMAKELARELASRLVEAGKYIAAVLLSRDAEILVCYTPENPPESHCPLRRLLIKLFGPRIGWSLPSIKI
jgi:hypothetical protein